MEKSLISSNSTETYSPKSIRFGKNPGQIMLEFTRMEYWRATPDGLLASDTGITNSMRGKTYWRATSDKTRQQRY